MCGQRRQINSYPPTYLHARKLYFLFLIWVEFRLGMGYWDMGVLDSSVSV